MIHLDKFTQDYDYVIKEITRCLRSGVCVRCTEERCNANRRYGVLYCIDCCKKYPDEYEILRKLFYK